MVYVSIAVNKPKGKGARDFIAALPELLQNSQTWKLKSKSTTKAIITSTATISSLPAPPEYLLEENAAGSVRAELQNANGWSHEQRVHALEPLVYLCLTALSSFVKDVRIDNP